MRNILLRLMYDGTNFHGWQVQPNGITVQECLQDALEKILGTRVGVTGCSRTDSGVHANDFCCNIHTENPIECYKLTGALNAILPDSISVKECHEVPDSFHSRYDCKKKQYLYKIWNVNAKNPFLTNYAYNYKREIDVEFLNSQAQQFVGTYDFTAFCASGSSVEDTTRTIYSFKVERHGNEVDFIVEGNGFLYNMVRIMVGTLLEISEKRIEKDTLTDIILSKDRMRAGRTAPAHGLYLNKVTYEEA